MGKLLSIIVPSYNMEAYLPKCLGSLVIEDKDLLQKLDVIVVNDGSKDRTSEIAHGFESKHPDVFQVIDKQNCNYGSCINAALPVARGLFVKVLDADDWFDTDAFEHYLRFINDRIDENYVPDLILNDFDFVDLDGKTTRHYSYAFAGKEGFSVGDFTFESDCAMWMHGAAYQTQKLRDIRYNQMEGVSYTDEEWISQPMTTVHSIAYFPGTVYKYLNGRQGQTCAPVEYLKSFWMQIKILKKLVAQYAKQAGTLPVGNEQYMRNHLSYRLRLTYNYLLLNRSVSPSNEEVVDFDSFLKETSPYLYGRSEEFLASRTMGFHFVREWRKRQTRKTFKFWLYDGFVALRSLLR